MNGFGMSNMTIKGSEQPSDDLYYEALVEFIRICRADDNLADGTRAHPSRRMRIADAHLVDVSTRYGIEKGRLLCLAANMLSGRDERFHFLPIKGVNGQPSADIGAVGDQPGNMDMSDADSDFAETSARMGYDGMVRATTRMIDGLRYEFGIVDMSESTIGTEEAPRAVVVHQDCDPDRPDQGASSRNDHATLELALADFEEEIRNAEARRPFGL